MQTIDYTHPLDWPRGNRKTPPSMKIQGRFLGRTAQKAGSKGSISPISLADAESALSLAVNALGGHNITIHTAMRVDKAGGIIWPPKPIPRQDAVVATFFINGLEYAVSCDKFTRFADNIAGVADYLSMAKRMVSMGAGDSQKVLKGFQL